MASIDLARLVSESMQKSSSYYEESDLSDVIDNAYNYDQDDHVEEGAMRFGRKLFGRSTAKDKLYYAGQDVKKAMRNTQKAASKSMKSTGKYISKNPGKSAAVGAGGLAAIAAAGLGARALYQRRKKKKDQQ